MKSLLRNVEYSVEYCISNVNNYVDVLHGE
jgi:hypothetical protein